MLTLQIIIRWEQIRDKPFPCMDYTNEDDIISLCYLCSQTKQTYSEFKESLSEEEFKGWMDGFNDYTKLVSQFQAHKKQSSQSGESTGEPSFIKQMVGMLIVAGVDANYLLYKADLCDLSFLLDAYEEQKKERLETERLWTYISVSPYLSGKTSSPYDLYPFPWEQEVREIDDKQQAELDMVRFEKMMNQQSSKK